MPKVVKKIRIFQVAKELNISHLEIMQYLVNNGTHADSHMTPVTPEVYDEILLEFSKDKLQIERHRKEQARKVVVSKIQQVQPVDTKTSKKTTIQAVRKIETSLKNEKLEKVKLLAKKFYYDGYMMNQLACNSPHFVFWVGKKNKKLQNNFWHLLNKIVEKRFFFDDVHVVDKYTNLMENIIIQKDFNNIKMFKNNLYIIDPDNKTNQIEDIRGVNGTFFQKNINQINTSIKLSLTISINANEHNKIKFFENTLNELDLVSNFKILKLNNINIYYKIVYNGSPNKFINEIKSKGIDLDTQSQIWKVQ